MVDVNTAIQAENKTSQQRCSENRVQIQTNRISGFFAPLAWPPPCLQVASTCMKRRMHFDVAKCHACHAKWRSMSPSATPATQTAAATTAPNGTQARHQSHPVPYVPRLPCKVTVDVTKRHACHVKWRWMSPSATQSEGRCHQVPRLPRQAVCERVVCVWANCVWGSFFLCVCVNCVCE